MLEKEFHEVFLRTMVYHTVIKMICYIHIIMRVNRITHNVYIDCAAKHTMLC